MKKRFFTLVMCILCSESAISQVMTDDAEGKSSIVQYGNSINFDLAKTALSASFNNYREVKIVKPKQFLWGVSASGKNSGGISTIFNAGKFVPESSLGVFVGSRKKIEPKTISQKRIDALTKSQLALRARPELENMKILLGFKPPVDELINKIPDSDLGQVEKSKLEDQIEIALGEESDQEKLEYLDSLVSQMDEAQQIQCNLLEELINQIRVNASKKEKLEPLVAEIFRKLSVISRQITSNKGPRIYRLFYFSGGINAQTFKYYDPEINGSFEDRFIKKPYRNVFFDLGVNYDYKANWLFGASVGYERANTFDDLDDRDYVIRNTDTSGNQQLITETKNTAYTGDFHQYDIANIRTDILYFKEIVKTDFQLAWDIVYTRSSISFNNDVAKGHFDIGTAMNFYNVKKGRFLGGVYLQTNDLFNSQDASTSVGERISFGIVAKYAFQSIANRFQPGN